MMHDKDSNRPSTLSAKERKLWCELSDRDAESCVGRARRLTGAERATLRALTKRMQNNR